MKDLVSLYPELEPFDGLPHALQSRLFKIVPDLQYVHGISFSRLKEYDEYFDRVGLYHLASRLVSADDRWVSVDIAVEQKLFILTVGNNNEALAFLETDNFDQTINILSLWFYDKINVDHLATIGRFSTFLNLADDVQYIRWQWAGYHRQAVNCGLFTRQLAPLFYEAMHDPVLSQITPFTSHANLFLSRYTEFPFDSSDYPIASPLLSPGLDNYYKRIVREQNAKDAEKAIIEIPPEIGKVVKDKNHKYELLNFQEEKLFRGDPINLLEYIIEHMIERYDILDRRGTGLVAENAKQAVKFLRNVLPSDWHRSIRGSAEDL